MPVLQIPSNDINILCIRRWIPANGKGGKVAPTDLDAGQLNLARDITLLRQLLFLEILSL